MKIRVLGAAAGGGFPQWNCNCPNCSGLRSGSIRATARTQSSIVVSTDGTNWVLFNASPDLLAQIKSFPSLQPGRGIRDTGIRAIVLIDGQIDHTTGLLMLREGKPLEIYCTDMVHEDLTTGNPLFTILGHYCGVNWNRLHLGKDAEFQIPGVDHLSFRPIPLKSKAPPYSPHRNNPHEGDNIGMSITDRRSGKSLFYAPGLGEIESHLQPLLDSASAVMVDGTFWTDDEMVAMGISSKTARSIGHLPQSGPKGMIEVLRPLKAAKKILIHINNTNPILNEDSSERAQLNVNGIEVAFDGMEFEL
jgi:pyrroloquinoline quinone biosynthesis protein B